MTKYSNLSITSQWNLLKAKFPKINCSNLDLSNTIQRFKFLNRILLITNRSHCRKMIVSQVKWLKIGYKSAYPDWYLIDTRLMPGLLPDWCPIDDYLSNSYQSATNRVYTDLCQFMAEIGI
jgi:hypothetical protein